MSATTSLPTDPRYDGKPLLRLMELYVLDAIDAVPERERATLAGMAPKLRALYGGDGSWQSAVAAAAGAPPASPGQIRELWARNQELARSRGVTLDAAAFARGVVDDNFAGR